VGRICRDDERVRPDAAALLGQRVLDELLLDLGLRGIAVPKLRGERCFIELDPERLGRQIPRVASLAGALKYGRLVGPHEVKPVDLVVCGSVAVTRQGARLGPGGGYSDLAYALLRAAGKIREYTPVLTTVHPLQIVDDELPMQIHDVPVDFVVTPSQVVAVPSIYTRPSGLIWGILSEQRIAEIPLLRSRRRSAPGTSSPSRP
jgi:5-formyltetrahydrofolate cyclo-ligase